MSAHHKNKGGEVDNRYHSIDEWLKFTSKHPVILEQLNRPRRVNYNYHIPYLGGISTDGNCIFIDSRYNPSLRLRGGCLDSAETIPDHELCEYICVQVLGMSYDAADDLQNPHVWGNTAEYLAVTSLGFDWDEYNAAIDAQLKDLHLEDPKNVTNAPPNLALYPYEDNPKLLAAIKAAQGK